MQDKSRAEIPTWFWVAGGVGLVWNLIGLAAFANQVTMDTSNLAAAERAYFDAIPLWATAAFCLAVVLGTLGCILLLVRKRAAHLLLVLSLVAIFIQVFESLVLANGLSVFGPAGLVLPLLTIGIGIALILLSRFAGQHEWLS